MEIKNITEENFRKYGKILKGYDFEELLTTMEKMPMPTDDVVYVPSVEELEKCDVKKELENQMYGGLPIQIGYCNGSNNKLNAVEYHRSSEVDISVNGLILLLGKQEDIKEDYTYDTANIEAFYVPAKMAVELYATTLHYAPCTYNQEAGFRCVVVLPKDTNTELTFELSDGESRLMTAKNKWLIAHEDAKIEGAFCGLTGENIEL
ncbi:MAG: DUF4867 family protein [Agathobacter sp.]|nr:DUF4867 family protein [Agathobacter sp.]